MIDPELSGVTDSANCTTEMTNRKRRRSCEDRDVRVEQQDEGWRQRGKRRNYEKKGL